jgi:hypothetical protein
VDVEPSIGAALSRDIAKGELVEQELTRFIEVRDRKRRLQERDRAEEEAWRESTRKANALREAELREQWSSFHLDQAARHRATLEALAAHHEERAEELMGGGDAA